MDDTHPPTNRLSPEGEDGSYLTLTRSVRGKDAGVRVRGEIDMASAPELAAFIAAVSAERPVRLAVDLTDVAFMDSSGVRMLVHAAQRAAAAGTRMYLVCPLSNTSVRRVMDILQLSTVMTIVDS